MTDNKIKKALDSADLFLRDRVNSKPAPLNEYDIEILLDIAKTCNNAVDLINCYETEIEKLQETKERLMYNLKAVLDERADHTEAVAEVFSRIESECVDTDGYFKYGAYLNLKCDMMKGR